MSYSIFGLTSKVVWRKFKRSKVERQMRIKLFFVSEMISEEVY